MAAARAGCLGAVLVAGQSGCVGREKGWRDSERENERGKTSVPTTGLSCRASQNIDLRSGGNQPLVVSVRVLIHMLSQGVFTEGACCCVDIFPVQLPRNLDGTGVTTADRDEETGRKSAAVSPQFAREEEKATSK